MAAVKQVAIAIALYLVSIQDSNAGSTFSSKVAKQIDCHFEYWDNYTKEWYGYHVVNISRSFFTSNEQGESSVFKRLCNDTYMMLQGKRRTPERLSLNSQEEADYIDTRLKLMENELRGNKKVPKKGLVLGLGMAGWYDRSDTTFIRKFIADLSKLSKTSAYYYRGQKRAKREGSRRRPDYTPTDVSFGICKARVTPDPPSTTTTSTVGIQATPYAGLVTAIIREHNHGPAAEQVDVAEFRRSLKRRAESSVEQPCQIIAAQMTGVTAAVAVHLPNQKAMRKVIARRRAEVSAIPAAPATLAGYVFPLLYCLLADKSARTYSRLFHLIRDHFPAFKILSQSLATSKSQRSVQLGTT